MCKPGMLWIEKFGFKMFSKMFFKQLQKNCRVKKHNVGFLDVREFCMFLSMALKLGGKGGGYRFPRMTCFPLNSMVMVKYKTFNQKHYIVFVKIVKM